MFVFKPSNEKTYWFAHKIYRRKKRVNTFRESNLNLIRKMKKKTTFPRAMWKLIISLNSWKYCNSKIAV